MANEKPIKILLIEDNPGDARLIQEMISGSGRITFDLKHADRLSKGLKELTSGKISVVLLDLSLPDSQGLGTFARLHESKPDVPVIVLTGLADEEIAVKAVREGAQDYLVKGHVDSNLLERAIRYAIERQRLSDELEQARLKEREELRAISLVDELTGLYNRRGFLTLADQQLKLADRTKKGMLILFVDLDHLKQINDTFGHPEGDLALAETASILKRTFRKSDIIARIGGDEFAVLAIESHKDHARILHSRLEKNIAEHNAQRDSRYKLSVSVGITFYDPESPGAIEELLSQADKLMYEHKLTKQNPSQTKTS